MAQIHGFAPLTTPTARILILGTMPGKNSLRLNQYYGHSQNAFWRITAAIFHFEATLAYEERVQRLLGRDVAVWDVLQLCTRESSLDSDIDTASIIPNDFASFLLAHPQLRRVCFNGAKAEQFYRQQVMQSLPDGLSKLEYVRLPSTSPANARVPYAQKLAEWTAALE